MTTFLRNSPTFLAALARIAALEAVTATGVRTRLSAARTLYVRTDGSDAGTGLADASAASSPNCAFATWQAAIDAAMRLDTNGYDVIVAAGSEAGTKTWNVSSVNIVGPMVGNGAIHIRGNGANTVINSSGDALWINGPVHAWIGSLKLISGGGYGCITVGAGAHVDFEASGPIFGSAVNAHIFVHENQGYVTALNSAYSIVGSAAAHLYAANNGTMAVEGCTVTITGSPTITNFAYVANGGYIQSTGCTWAGSVTARKYYADGGIISTLGNGVNYFPGATAGTLTSGGSYVDSATVGFNIATIATMLKLGGNLHQIYDSAANEITIALANGGSVSSYVAFKNNGSGQPMLSGPSGRIGLGSGATEIAYADTNGLHLTQGGIYVPEATAASITTPASGNQALFIDTADHKLKRKNSSGVVLPSNLLTFNAVEYGMPTDGVSDCAPVLNSLMATVAAQGGGIIEIPVATCVVGSTIDNKYSNVFLVGSSKTEDNNAGSGRSYGTTIVPSFAGTVLKHRTPYSVSSSQFTGGGFKGLRVIGNSLATRLLEVDSILSGIYDLYLYESVGADAAWFHSGVSGTDLAECRGIQNASINLRIRQDGQSGASAAASADCVIFDGSSNTNFSFNDDITLDIVHKNGRGAYFKGCDNNFVRRIRVYRSAGGSGNGIVMGGRSTAQANVGGEQTLFGLVSCNSPIVANAQGTGGTGTRFNKILALDTGNWPTNFPTTADSTATWEWDDVLGSGSWDWTDFTPTYTTDGGAIGTITTSRARYRRHKKTIFFDLEFQIVGAGTATGALRFSGMPTPVSGFAASASDTTASKVLSAFWSSANSAVRISSATGTTPIVAGDFYAVTGFYEVA